MKRCFSLALILALLGSTPLSTALAEDSAVVAESAEVAATEIDELGDIYLTPEEDAGLSPEQTATEAIGESPVEHSAVMASEEEQADEEQPSNIEEEDASEKAASSLATASEIQFSAKSITIGVKEKYKDLTVTALPEGALLPAISWRSSNTRVAKVNSKGVITGVRTGTAKIYAKAEGSKKEIKCSVTVKKAPKKVKLDSTSKSLGVGMGFQLKPSVPKGYGCGKYTFTSSDESVAVVDATGTVVGLGVGNATITVKAYNGKKKKCKITVLDAPASLVFSDNLIPLAVDQTTELDVTALTASGEATPAVVTFSIDGSSPDAECIVLDEATGKLTGVHKGEAVIRATTHNGVVARCAVKVDIGPAAVTLNTSSVTIGVKEVYVGVIVDFIVPNGESSCAQVVTWSSSNKKIAKVDPETGAITGVKKGSCTIKAKTPNGLTASCKVKVRKAPTKKTVKISPSIGVLTVGGKCGQYKVTMASGYGGSLTFESSDPSVATVDNEGIVTPVSAGTCKITVTTYNGIQKTAELVVNGKDPIGDNGDDGKAITDAEKIEYMLILAKSKEGKPYVYGSFGPNSFDCSGFAYWCYKQINVKLKDSAYKQGYDSKYPQISYGDLKPGDLVFFNTVNDSDLSDHSGIYLGNYKFIHASSSAKKVVISSLKSGYYKRNFSWGRRVFY